MSEHRYKLSYTITPRPEGFTKEQAIAEAKEGRSACDAVFLASIIYPEDGSLSMLFVGEDGRTGKELEHGEWFKVFSLLAHRLARSDQLGEGRRLLCELVHEAIRGSLTGGPGNIELAIDALAKIARLS